MRGPVKAADRPTAKSRASAQSRGPQSPRPVTARYLRNAAMHYIASRAASTAMVREILGRRAKRRLGVKALEAETRAEIDTVIGGLVELGLIDDARFAVGRAASLTAKGLPRRRVAHGLRAKGIAPETIAAAIDVDFDEAAQARRFVERKRLGALRRGGMTPETRQKDLRALARAGFGFRVAADALDRSGDA